MFTSSTQAGHAGPSRHRWAIRGHLDVQHTFLKLNRFTLLLHSRRKRSLSFISPSPLYAWGKFSKSLSLVKKREKEKVRTERLNEAINVLKSKCVRHQKKALEVWIVLSLNPLLVLHLLTNFFFIQTVYFQIF